MADRGRNQGNASRRVDGSGKSARASRVARLVSFAINAFLIAPDGSGASPPSLILLSPSQSANHCYRVFPALGYHCHFAKQDRTISSPRPSLAVLRWASEHLG